MQIIHKEDEIEKVKNGCRMNTAMKVKRDCIRFTKMHGAGNDYVYVDAVTGAVPDIDLPELARRISDRHFGIGSDGLVLIMPSGKADFRMRMFNADGSEAQMCGNASRCIGRYVYERGLTDKTELTLETKAGIKNLSLNVADGTVEGVVVNMGAPILLPESVPVKSSSKEGKINERETINGKTYFITAVSMGNPHAVIFPDRLDDELVREEGAVLECAEIFPEKANIEFVKVLSPSEIKMRVWERGTGETLACGTGACAAVVAAVLNGYCSRNVDVHLPGGTVNVKWDASSGDVSLSGPAEFIADGDFYI